MDTEEVFVLYRSGVDNMHVIGVFAAREDAKREAERLHGVPPLNWHPYAHTGLRANLPLTSRWTGYFIEPVELIPHGAAHRSPSRG